MLKGTGKIVHVLLILSLLFGTVPADAVTFQQVPTGGGTATSSQPVVTGQSYGAAAPGEASRSGNITRDTSPPLRRSAANQIGEAYREMALVAVEAHVDLSNFIYADPAKTSETEMELRYERCMKSLDDLEKKARRVDQAVEMARIAAVPLLPGEMQALVDLLYATPAYAGYAPRSGSYSMNQTGMFSPLKQISAKITQRLCAVKAGAGVMAGAATFTAGVTLVVTATPLGIAVGIPLAIGGVLGGADAIITGTEDMQSVSTDDLGYEMMPSDSPERKMIAKGAKIGNYISIVTSTKSAGEFITSVLQAPNEAAEAAELVGTPLGNALGEMLSGQGGSSSGTGVAGGSAELAGPEPPLCPGT